MAMGPRSIIAGDDHFQSLIARGNKNLSSLVSVRRTPFEEPAFARVPFQFKFEAKDNFDIPLSFTNRNIFTHAIFRLHA